MLPVQLFGALIVVFAADPVADSTKKDQALLEGEWSMVSGASDGFSLSEDLVNGAKRVSKDGVTTVTIGGTTFIKAKYTIDTAKKPKTIDFDLQDGPNKGKKQLGIYELDGDDFKVCYAAVGLPRPDDFTSKERSGRTLGVWKRVKK